MSNPTGKGGFGEHKERIWKGGRPKSFDALRELAQQIAHEKTNIVADGHAVTVTEAILRQWAQSKNPQLQKGFLEIAFGKVPDNITLSGEGAIILKVLKGVDSEDV